MPGVDDVVVGTEETAIDPLEGGASEAEVERASALLDEREGALWALAEGEVAQPRIGRAVAWGQTLHVLRQIEPYRALLSKEYAEARQQRVEAAIERVKDDALVLAMAELRRADAEAAMAPRDGALAARVRQLDQRLFSWAEVLGTATPQSTKTLADIRKGRGNRDDAEDVIRLVRFLRPLTAGIQGIAELAPEALDAAERDATAQLRELEQQAAQDPKAPKALVARAYTVWQSSYLEIVRAGRDLAFDEADSERRFPKPSATWGTIRSVSAAEGTTERSETPELVEA